jgi:hypothetical protein
MLLRSRRMRGGTFFQFKKKRWRKRGLGVNGLRYPDVKIGWMCV